MIDQQKLKQQEDQGKIIRPLLTLGGWAIIIGLTSVVIFGFIGIYLKVKKLSSTKRIL